MPRQRRVTYRIKLKRKLKDRVGSRIDSRTYGTVSADKQKEMTGLEFVQGLADGTLPLNTIAKTLGAEAKPRQRRAVIMQLRRFEKVRTGLCPWRETDSNLRFRTKSAPLFRDSSAVSHDG